MKKVFPLIVLLITLSVLGIIFIQVSWINNSLQLRQQQRAQDIEHAETQIKESLYDMYLIFNGYINVYNQESREYYLRSFTVQDIPQAEVAQKIDTALKRYNIKEPFEYSITNIFQMPIMKSEGFDNRDPEATLREIALTSANSSFYETLHLYIKEDRNFLHNRMGWYIAGSILFTIIIISAFTLTVLLC